MKLFKKRERPYWPREFDYLAEYNSEIGRGIVHTPEWDKYMKQVQERFNENTLERMSDG